MRKMIVVAVREYQAAVKTKAFLVTLVLMPVMMGGGVVHLENGFSLDTREALESLGHTLGESDGSFGGYQAIMWDADEGVYYGASEVRKDGQAAGF